VPERRAAPIMGLTFEATRSTGGSQSLGVIDVISDPSKPGPAINPF
jgi:hypothetical protein